MVKGYWLKVSFDKLRNQGYCTLRYRLKVLFVLFTFHLVGELVEPSLFTPTQSVAQNPIIQTKYTADPAPYVHGDTVYLYTTHDEDDAQGFHMLDWLCYTSTDMVNWTDHGAVASVKDFSKWYNTPNGAWAEQVIERNGKWYMYCPLHGHGIGVLVSDGPFGPFNDPLGHALVWQREHWDDIDPTVWIDDDGQAYMYWGNPNLYCAKLNEDMISIDPSFGKNGIMKMDPKPDDYQEGPWFWKHGKYYYLAFASTCCPEGIGVSMSKSPLGPWKESTPIMNHTPKTRGNHPGIIEYKGHNYVFGLNYDLFRRVSDLHAERRSVAVAEFQYNKDGSISEIPYFDEHHIAPLQTLDPFRRNEAETIAWSDGLKTKKDNKVGIYVTEIHDGDFIKVANVDFGKGAKHFKASVASMYRNGSIELRIDDISGRVIGQCQVNCTGGDLKWAMRECDVTPTTSGVHDLYFIFHSTGKYPMFDFDWWQFE